MHADTPHDRLNQASTSLSRFSLYMTCKVLTAMSIKITRF